jgi:hypothetical protein
LNFIFDIIITPLRDIHKQPYYIYFSKLERKGSDVSLKSTSSEKLLAGLYENNANYSNDSICSNLSRSSDGLEWYPMATSDMDTYKGQEVEGAYDIIVYIGRFNLELKYII